MMRLNELHDAKGAKANKKRVGRGIGSGLGKTAGRGFNGQKSRSGVAIKGFEGGQMPIDRRLPKRGFNNLFGTSYELANLGRIQKAIDEKKLSATGKITAKELHAAGVIGSLKNGVKLLAKGEIKTKLDIEVAKASGAATKAIEKAGGKVTVTFDVEAEAKKKEAKAELRRVKAKKGKKSKAAQEAGKADAKGKAKADAPKGDAPQGDAPQGDAPQGDAPKGDAKDEGKLEPKAEAKVEAKAEPKAEAKPDAKPEASEKTEGKE